MIVMGVDPGIGRTGWGVIKIQNSKIKSQNYGCIETEAHTNVEERLKTIFNSLQSIITTHQPQTLAIEELFFNTNAKTAMVVGQARGVVLLTASLANLSVAVYTPLQVKIALTGYGRAEKSQVGQMVKILLKLPSMPKPDDVTDALAVALTHAFSSTMHKATSASNKK